MLNKSSFNPLFPHPETPIQPHSGWGVLFGPDVADADYTIESPYEVDIFDPDVAADLSLTPLSWTVAQGGRIHLLGQNTGRFEVLPLFTDDGATAVVQLFGFAPVERTRTHFEAQSRRYGQVRLIAPDMTTTETGDNLLLGVPYPICKDISGNPSTVTFTADDTHNEFISVTTTDNTSDGAPQAGVPYVDRDAGTNYVYGTRNIFDSAGHSAVFAWVSSVSSGSLLLLARSI